MTRDDIDEQRHPLAGSPARFAATLIAALVGTSPAFASAIDGEMTLPEALLRFLVAFVVFWVVGAVVSFAFRRTASSEDLPDETPSDMPEMVPGSAAADR
jgi:hypothetical protein